MILLSVVRWIIAFVLLHFVYKNAHWSVLVILILLTLRAEIQDAKGLGG
jgi:hypothetical protein